MEKHAVLVCGHNVNDSQHSAPECHGLQGIHTHDHQQRHEKFGNRPTVVPYAGCPFRHKL